MRPRMLFTILMCTATLTAVPTDSGAQGFLKIMKQRAEKAVGKVIGVEEHEKETSPKDNEEPIGTPTATDRIPKLRQSAVVWDGEVQPSRANSVRALLGELPALPTVNEVVYPAEAIRTAYYNRLVSINLRVNELDDEWACSDEEMLALRDKAYKELEGILGLTIEEMKRLDDPNISDAERARLEEKAKNHLLGGADLEGLSAKAQSKEARLEQLSKEMEIFEKKEKNGTLTEADKKRMMEISQEMMAMQQEIFGGLGNLMNTAKQADVLTQKMSREQATLNRRLKVMSDKIAALRRNEAGVVKSCEEIAGEYEERLRHIYAQVWRSDNADEIHRLYDQADELMKNYRTRAAKVFLQGLQMRLNNAKKLLPEAEALYQEMADNEWIPACAMRRAPLNIVTQCVDILNEAYSAFPQPDVLPVEQTAFEFLGKDERVLYGESGFAGGFSTGSSSVVNDFITGSHLLVFNTKDQCYYEIAGGKRRNLGQEEKGWNFAVRAQRSPETYGDIPLRKASRKATYNRGGTLTLHDGTMLFPLMMKRYADRLEFIIRKYNNNSQEQFVKCVYKL